MLKKHQGKARVAGWSALLLVVFLPAWAEESTTATAASPTSPPSANPSPMPSRAMVTLGLNSEALAERFPERAVWLETELYGRALVLFEPERAAKAAGAVLMLADEGQSADTGVIEALRQPLTEAGWAAMTLGLPALPLALEQSRRVRQAPRPVNTADEGGGASVEAAAAPDSVMIDVMDDDKINALEDRYYNRVQAQLSAAVMELTRRGYQRVLLVGLGQGAMQATRQAIAGKVMTPAVVWIAPEFDAIDRSALVDLLKSADDLPVLELTSSRARGPFAQARKSLMQREGIRRYRQQLVAMPPRPLPRDALQLANRITAWANDL
ncbi:DUF3530 family protein [Marinobacter caseinilyticus]|uniref:DUF3530 family protein n=1 Tax=Marinobacter caseinilyticus TaxID=2692195 RepID=UPI00140DC605|nr:DUF3530 family protein [Marinobacter caseinilyticus]